LIGIVIHLCNRKDVMGEYTNSKTSNILGLVTWGVMTACAVMLIIAFLE
jgi:Mn2+/Fe2+ NRAMP family transporter